MEHNTPGDALATALDELTLGSAHTHPISGNRGDSDPDDLQALLANTARTVPVLAV